MDSQSRTARVDSSSGKAVRFVSADDPAACRALLAALGGTPRCVLAHHLLSRGWGRACVVADSHQPDAAVVDTTFEPGVWPAGEPTGIGTDTAALWAALRVMDGWGCVLVERDCAEPLGELIQAETGQRVKYYGEVF